MFWKQKLKMFGYARIFVTSVVCLLLALEDDDLTVEETELNAKLSKLNAEVARANASLADAVKLSADTQGATIRALIAVEKARDEANRIQEEIELKGKLEAERRETEKRRREEGRKRAEEERIRQDKEKREKELRWRRKAFGMDGPVVWENWPVHEYPADDHEDANIACLIRGHPSSFSERDVECSAVDQMGTIMSYEPLEEMISSIIKLKHKSDELKDPIYVSIPHNMTRLSASSRECVVKGEESGEWKELPTTEVSFEKFKDMKFAQAEVKECTALAVFSRLKRDHIMLSRKAAKVISSYDHRVTLTTRKDTFKNPERLLLQVQPIDSGSIHDFRSRNAWSKSLLTSSPLMITDWESKEFDHLVEINLPCPPNPAKAKKLAAIRAAKEAKMRNPKSALEMLQEQERERESQRRRLKNQQPVVDDTEEKKQTRWYMGEYGNSDDDENDTLYLVAKTGASKWFALDNVPVILIKLDVVQFHLPRPVDSGEDPFDAILCMSPVHKVEKLEKELKEDGYDEGPSVTNPFFVEEGEIIHITFRGNVQSEKSTYHLVYNSNVKTQIHFKLSEVDKYLQRNFAEYRGYIQIYKNNRLLCSLEPKNFKSDGTKMQVQQRPPTKELLSEIMVQVPKVNLDQMSSPVKAPVHISNGPVGQDMMRHIATELKDDWKKVANCLNVNRVRIQCIQRNINNGDISEEDGRYEMLTTWLKRMPKADDKASLLSTALLRCGRGDLSQYIKENRQRTPEIRPEVEVED